ncbi:hypothetical protein EHS25_008185 [Saitozyma podzolica]|uniref:Cytoplasmic tRNA 2-thiolation protein 2 n=1 Tax=Saitozyma podzolica TaxID=1890683 RepID=A0A427YNW4_9TREE|nr:hypothetical protein EHS25_008185 [Saitozyma podzolica]
MAMLDMLLQHGYVGKGDGKTADLTKGEREVLWDRGTVVYVEFAGVTGMEDRMGAMKTLAEEKGLRFVGLRAEEAFDSTLGQKLGRPSASPGGIAVDLSNPSLPLLDLPSASSPASASAPDPLLRLQTLLASLPAPSRPALLAHILSHLLNLAAYSIPNVSHLLLGETSTREAQRVVSGTALGRGWALPLELASATPLLAPNTDSASDPPPTTLDVSAPINPAPAPIPAAPQSITRLKPMKDVTLKEAALYCHLRGIPTVNHRKWTSEAGGGSDARGKGVHTIESLTEAFIAGLDVTHPATVSTINKTGDKLVFNGDSPSLPGPENCCPVCQTPAEPSAQAWKSRTALTSLPGRTKSIESAVPDSTDDHSGSVELAPMLCYSCLTTFTPSSTRKGTDKGQPAYLPQWVAESVRKREVPREEMRAGISGFLLDGE